MTAPTEAYDPAARTTAGGDLSAGRFPWVWRWFAAAADFVFPRLCPGCGHRIVEPAGAVVCDVCLASIPSLKLPLCPRCGAPAAIVSAKGRCVNCPLGPPHLDGLRCAAEYGGVAEVLVEKLKYKGRVEFAPAMALAMAGAVAHGWPGLVFDAAVPVPLHGARQRQRGFNQAETLAQALAGAGGPPVWTGALKRIRPTPSQTRMGRRGRAANVRGAFAACGGGGELAGARLLLIDDVATTGATLSECARVLKAAGAATVHAAAYGRALNVARK